MLIYRLLRGGPRDLQEILALRAAYCAEDGVAAEPSGGQALEALLGRPDLGAVWLVRVERRAVGYAAVCYGYSLELGGRDAFVDELFVTEELRGQGLGRKLLEKALAAGRAEGVKAFHLEVSEDNEAAQALYADFGFRPRSRRLLTRTE